jgi:hypothetical protein
MHNKRRAGVKNTTLKAQKKEEALILKEIKALKVAQKKEEAQILKDVKAQKKEVITQDCLSIKKWINS